MKKSIKEGSMSDIDVMAKEATTFKEFVKEFYKEFRDFPKNREAMKWLEDTYKSVSESVESDELERVADGLPQTVEETINEISLSSAGVRDFLRAIYRNNKIVKKLGFANFKGVVDYIRGSGGRDWDELRDEATAFGLQFESVDEAYTTMNPGTSGRTTTHLDSKEYELTKDVKGAKIGNYINVVLPKGTIIYNLKGGVFANHPTLKTKYATGYGSQKWDSKYGVGIIRHPETLNAIEKSSKILESVNEGAGCGCGCGCGGSSLKENTEPSIISQLKDIVKHNQSKVLVDPKSGKKMRVDLFSASAITQVYDGLKQQSNKDKFVGSGLLGMQSMAMKLLK